VDVGNTSAAFGFCAGARIAGRGRQPTRACTPPRIARALAALVRDRPLDGIVYASVVPSADRVWLAVLRRLWPGRRVLRVSHRLRTGFRFRYPRPETLGADRIANAAGAVARWGPPVIVVDIGTATTFDVVSRRGFEGGVIAPGPDLMLDYLADRTAKLPRLKPAALRGWIGKNTAQAMQLGARWGYRGVVESILTHLACGVGLRAATIVVTGGYARSVFPCPARGLVLDPDLTLRGLARIHSLNAD